MHGVDDRPRAQHAVSVSPAAAGAALRCLARRAAIGARARLLLRRRASSAAFVSRRAPRRARSSSASASTPRRSRRTRATSRIRNDSITDDEAARHRGRSDAPDYLAGRGIPFRRRHRLYGRFALYGGRVESDNGCEEMLEYFDTLRRYGRATPRSC